MKLQKNHIVHRARIFFFSPSTAIMKRLMYKVVTITLLKTAKETLAETGLYMNEFNVYLYFSHY